MKARYCLKGGVVDWSGSPNAEDFPVDGPAPFDGKTLTRPAMRQVMADHYEWQQSGGAAGREADLRGAVLSDGVVRLLGGKIREGGKASAGLWLGALQSAVVDAPAAAKPDAQVVEVGTVTTGEGATAVVAG